MLVKALDEIATLSPVRARATAGTARTYSIEPNAQPEEPRPATTAHETELAAFLEEEHPLGCVRGVMWVMAFNAAAFLVGLTVWASFRHLFR